MSRMMKSWGMGWMGRGLGRALPASLAIAAGLCLGVSALHAQDAAPAPAPAPAAAPAPALEVTVTAVQGLAQVRPAEDQPWRPATVGMVVGEGAEFRTGPRSLVQFRIPPDQIVTLDRLGTVKVLEATRKSEAVVRTDLGMKYGRTNYRVEAAGVEHDTTIRSPAATLAVRGTREMSLDNTPPFPATAFSRDTVVRLVNWLNTYGDKPTEVTFGGEGEEGLDTDDDSPQDRQRRLASVDAGDPNARDGLEQGLVNNHPLLNGMDLGNVREVNAGVPNLPDLPDEISEMFAIFATNRAEIPVTVFGPQEQMGCYGQVDAYLNGQLLEQEVPLVPLDGEAVPRTFQIPMDNAFAVFTLLALGLEGDSVSVGVLMPKDTNGPRLPTAMPTDGFPGAQYQLTEETPAASIIIYRPGQQ